MIYLLDTDTIIFMVRGLKEGVRPRQRRTRALKLVKNCQLVQREGHSVGVSAITISELEFGAQNSDNYDTEISALRKILLPFDAYDYDAVRCPESYGPIRFALAKKGRTIGAMDMLIAAHAMSLDATLVTSNESHFRRVSGLKVESWPST